MLIYLKKYNFQFNINEMIKDMLTKSNEISFKNLRHYYFKLKV